VRTLQAIIRRLERQGETGRGRRDRRLAGQKPAYHVFGDAKARFLGFRRTRRETNCRDRKGPYERPRRR
jgi:hypothetical protein